MTTKVVANLFNFADKLQMESMNQRLQRSNVISANIANAETPGFRALGYDFEEQLQAIAGNDGNMPMKATDGRHFQGQGTMQNGAAEAEVYIRPTESIGQDGNTVDMDGEMAQLAQNQLLYRTAVESLNRKIGTLRYAINGGR